jgi:hypothetical protein
MRSSCGTCAVSNTPLKIEHTCTQLFTPQKINENWMGKLMAECERETVFLDMSCEMTRCADKSRVLAKSKDCRGVRMLEVEKLLDVEAEVFDNPANLSGEMMIKRRRVKEDPYIQTAVNRARGFEKRDIFSWMHMGDPFEKINRDVNFRGVICELIHHHLTGKSRPEEPPTSEDEETDDDIDVTDFTGREYID